MTLQQLIDQLEDLKTEHGSEIEVEFTIPAHEGSYESDYSASELTEVKPLAITWLGEKQTLLHLTLQ